MRRIGVDPDASPATSAFFQDQPSFGSGGPLTEPYTVTEKPRIAASSVVSVFGRLLLFACKGEGRLRLFPQMSADPSARRKTVRLAGPEAVL